MKARYIRLLAVLALAVGVMLAFWTAATADSPTPMSADRAAFLGGDGVGAFDRTEILDYDTDIKPILDLKCTSCHVTEYHDLATFPERRGACYTCHDGPGPGVMPTTRAYPPLTTEDEVLFAVRQGTFTSWIQPGGFMNWDGSPDFDGNPYPQSFAIVQTGLTGDEVSTLTSWADSIQRDRQLGYDPNLLAAETADFDLDGTGANPAWNAATELTVDLGPTVYTPTDQIQLKALYSDEYLYIRAEWADSTLSMTRGGWLRDTSGNTWMAATADPALADDYPSEDRVAFIWNKNIPEFKTISGCAVKCHANQPGYASFTDIPGTKADIWHAKANRSLPVTSTAINSALTVDPTTHEVTAGSATLTGFVDDKELEWYLGPRFDTEDAGRHGDAGSGTYDRNRNAAKTAPKYMETSPADFLDAMVLTQTEIDGGQTIVTDPDDAGYAGDPAANAAWASYAALNAVVPERILHQPSGSRGDVEHAATWTDGVWVNEFKRKLDTGDGENDVLFNDLYKPYEFSVAVFDNCGRGEIPPGHTTYGNGQYLTLRFLPFGAPEPSPTPTPAPTATPPPAASPTPTPTPPAGPSALPPTGGLPPSAGSDAPWLAAVIVALLLVPAALATAYAARPRTPAGSAQHRHPGGGGPWRQSLATLIPKPRF